MDLLQNSGKIINFIGEAPLGIILVNTSGIVEYANKLACSLALQSKVHGQTLLSNFPFLVTFDNGREIETTIERKSSLIHLRVSKTKITKQGDILITLADVSSQKKMLQENNDLRQRIVFLENILKSIDEGILAVDNQGFITFMNNTQEKLDNIKFNEVKGTYLATHYHLNERTSLLLQVLETGNRIPHQPQYYLTGGGYAVNIITSTTPLYNKNEVIGAVSISQDYNVTRNIFDQIGNMSKKARAVTSRVEEETSRKSKYTNNGTYYSFEDIIGESREIKETIEWAKRSAPSMSNVLLYGKTGTGKELFAQSIHNASARRREAFVAVNCAALPESLLESILFGTTKGAFTGAVDRPGLFEQASNGTLFLDEINSMPLFLQSKLLRVLQEGRVRRIGGTTEINALPRVISSLNIEPEEAIICKQLRNDLFYRLAVVSIDIPPLQERKEDIHVLTNFFLQKYNHEMNKNIEWLSNEVLDLFMAYDWPGNVRELQHVLEGTMNIIPEDQNCITVHYLPHYLLKQFASQKSSRSGESKPDTEAFAPSWKASADRTNETKRNPLTKKLKEAEKKEVVQTLLSTRGNISKSARILGMSRQNLQHKIKRYNILLKNME